MKDLFSKTLIKFSLSEIQINNFWEILDKNYSKKNRHYHNWHHIQQMISLWKIHKLELENSVEVLLAIFYHDAIYKVTRKDNEAKSAAMVLNHLEKVKNLDLENIKKLILATQFHMAKTNDEKWLVDFDLHILGSNWEDYEFYAQNIRKEYGIYPDFLYTPGRKKALKHFLEKEFIFQTKEFREKYEENARRNILKEISELNN
jgi:predicted metal-dependent HD superfamily phosphohydrolase